MTRTLIILDLDHTLIFGSYAQNESSKLLFRYNSVLKIYERPFVREFIDACKSIGDIIVFTTAKRDYAKKICYALNIRPRELLTRTNCKQINGKYVKSIRPEWYDTYDDIRIVDDSPYVWSYEEGKKVSFIVPRQFMGNSEDDELQKLTRELSDKYKI